MGRVSLLSTHYFILLRYTLSLYAHTLSPLDHALGPNIL